MPFLLEKEDGGNVKIREQWKNALALLGAGQGKAGRKEETAQRKTVALPSVLSPYAFPAKVLPKPTPANLRKFAETPVVRRAINPVSYTHLVADYLPEEQLAEVRNLHEFTGALVLDKWTCNANGRQTLFYRKGRERRYSATFIDQGFCFNAGEWRFIDAPLRGVYARNVVYRDVTGWESFEPWLSRVEELGAQGIWEIAETLPPEWYEGDAEVLEGLVNKLIERRSQVRDLITTFRESSRQPFPNWNKVASGARSRQFPGPGWGDRVTERMM